MDRIIPNQSWSSLLSSIESEVFDSKLSWHGSFLNGKLEREYRQDVWPSIIYHQGILCGIASLLYLLAGLCPILEMGFTPVVTFLSIFRLVVSSTGIFLFFYVKRGKVRFYPVFFIVFIISLGCYEAVEAVLTYVPDLEYSTPFTLLIIFIIYILFPLSLKYTLPSALFSSVLYVACLKIFIITEWYNLIQLSLFFVAANVMGSYFLILLSSSSRKQFAYTKHIIRLNKQLKAEIKAKEITNAKLAELAVMDPLTGIANRRKFMDVAADEWAKTLRYGQPMSLIIIDIDFFKKVNDTYGHAMGDAVLKNICQRISSTLREVDCFARLGGEEFGVIMPNTKAMEAKHLSERILKVISESPIEALDSIIPVTVSAGIAERKIEENDSFQQLFHRADMGLYLAKQNGRNQVQICLDAE